MPGALSLCCLSHLWHAWTSTPLCSYHCSASTQPSGAHDTSPPPSSQDLQKITCTLDTDQLCRHPGWQMGAQTIFSDPNKEFSKWLLQHSFCLCIQVLHNFFTLRLALLYPLVPASSSWRIFTSWSIFTTLKNTGVFFQLVMINPLFTASQSPQQRHLENGLLN